MNTPFDRRRSSPRLPAKPSTPPVRSRHRLRLQWAAVSALVVLFGAALTVIDRRPEYLCRRWEIEARQAEGEKAAAFVARLDAYGPFGLPAVVRLLDCERTETVAAARDALLARLRPSAVGAEADESVLNAIAGELESLAKSRGNDRVSPAMIDVALTLLETIGRLSVDDALDQAARMRMVFACDEVLRRAPAPVGALAEILDRPRPAMPAPASNQPVTLPPPVDAVPVEENLPATAEAPTNIAPGRFADAALRPAAVRTISASVPQNAANAAARIDTAVDDSSGEDVHRASAEVAGSGGPLGSEAADRRRPSLDGDVTRLDAWTLFAALDDERAAAELRRRGFTPRELQIGKALAGDDVEVRRRYAKMLPSLAGIDVRPWLDFLSRDADAEVRRSAVAIMATTNDPALLHRLRTMAIEDADDEVRATAARTGEQKR